VVLQAGQLGARRSSAILAQDFWRETGEMRESQD